MKRYEARLRDILDRHELVLGTVVSKDGELVAQEGDRSRCACLADALLGPHGDAKATYESLEGQLLPRMWAQGKLFAILDRPAKGLMVAVFGADEATTVKTDPVARAKARYLLSKQVAESIRDHFSEVGA